MLLDFLSCWARLNCGCQYNCIHQEKTFVPAIHLSTSTLPFPTLPSHLTLRPNLNPLILPRLNIRQRPLKVLPRALQPTDILRRIQITLDQFNKAVDVLCGDGVVFLVEVVDVAVEDLDEELHADGRVHAGVGDA